MNIFILVFIAIAALAVIIHYFTSDASNNHNDDTSGDETGDEPFLLDDSLLNDPINAWNPANIYHDSFSDSPMHHDDDMFTDTDMSSSTLSE